MPARQLLAAATGGGLIAAVLLTALLLVTGSLGDGDEGSAGGSAPPPGVRTGASTASAPSVAEVFKRASAGIVRIDARDRGTKIPDGPPREDDDVATGTAFLVDDDGFMVTNEHVVAGGNVVTIQPNDGGRRINAQVVGRDASTDIALIKIDPADAPKLAPLPLGNSKDVHVGDTALAIGNPFGLERSLTVGVVSGTDREIDAPNGASIENAVQTDAPINPGNSGGPLLDDTGHVIGVNSQARAQGIGFAVPVDTVKDVIDGLRRDGKIERGYLGVLTSDGAGGAEVVRVDDGTPAAEAKLRKDDVIVSIDGEDVKDSANLGRVVGSHKAGDKVKIEVKRGDRTVTLTATLGERPRG